MSVDGFGRNLGKIEGSRGPPSVGFKVPTDGHYDMENKKNMQCCRTSTTERC